MCRAKGQQMESIRRRDSGEIGRQGEEELNDDELEKHQRFFRLRPSTESCPVPGRDGAWLFHPPDVWRRQSPRFRSSERRSPYRQEHLLGANQFQTSALIAFLPCSSDLPLA
jgi:hypothetical protein